MSVSLELLDQIMQAFNDKDVDRIVEFFDDEGEFLLARGPSPHGQVFKGKAAIRKALEERLGAIPDIQWTQARNWVFGDKALSEWRVIGTLPDGSKLDSMGCDLWEFRGGKVLKKDVYYKQAG